MKKIRTKIYVKVSPENNEVVFSGIEFAEFIEYLPKPIENLMLITGGSSIILAETNVERGLELFEGFALIKKLIKQDIYNLGNFCFVDYASAGNTSGLSEEQIAELLYMGHMFKPLHLPFFDQLRNRFAYLAHDDGWYCKLYCKNLLDFITVLCKKITADAPIKDICEPSNDVKEKVLKLTTDGLLIDLDESSRKSGSLEAKLYVIGAYSDMDTILNNYQKLKESATQIHSLRCDKTGWSIS